jgi:hypothetical protein
MRDRGQEATALLAEEVLHCHMLGGGRPTDFVEPMNDFAWPMTQSLVETA